MKVLLLPLLSILTFLTDAQQDFNKLTKRGQRTGEWRTYHDNGKVKSSTFYEPYQMVYDKAIAFQLGLFPDYVGDSIYRYKTVWEENYEYNSDWNLERIKRCYGHWGCSYHTDSVIYLFGEHRQISLDSTRFYRQGKVGELVNVTIPITNHLERHCLLDVNDSSNSFSFSTGIKRFSLPPNTTDTLDITFRLKRGEHFRTIVLSDSITDIQINIATFGYDIETADLIEKQLSLPKKFIYYRTGEEALLTLIDQNRTDTLSTVSLKFEKTTVDLSKHKSGDYILSTIDFSKSEIQQCIIRLEDD